MQLVAFEGGTWHEDGVRASEQAEQGPDAAQRRDELEARVEETIRSIAQFPCTPEGRLSDASERQVDDMATEVDGQAIAVGLEPLPGAAIRGAASQRDLTFRREFLQSRTRDRVSAFDAAVGQVPDNAIEFPELGLGFNSCRSRTAQAGRSKRCRSTSWSRADPSGAILVSGPAI